MSVRAATRRHYDAKTGALLWRFYAVPENPADGFESELMALTDQGTPSFDQFLNMEDVQALRSYLEELASPGDQGSGQLTAPKKQF